MPIVCGVTSPNQSYASDAGFEAASALAERASLGPVHVVVASAEHAVGAGGFADALIRTAAEQAADMLVVAAGAGAATTIDRLAHDVTVPLLVVRDATPFVAWGAGRRSLRAVLGWDATATTAAAVEPLVALRRAGRIDVEVVHVYFPDEAARRYGVRIGSMVEPSAELEALLRRDIAHDLGELAGAGAVEITLARGLGHIGDPLLERAESSATDLVVVGNHHRDGLRRLSSVAARVLHEASISVLLVPLRPDAALDRAPGFNTAVVATDGSAFANRAIPYAYRLVPDSGEVHLVQVVAADESADDRALIEALLRLRPPGRPTARTIAHVVRDRDPAHAIATAAERIGADVVCIASHGRVGVARILIGSVTDRLLHVCRRPVLVLHPVE